MTAPIYDQLTAEHYGTPQWIADFTQRIQPMISELRQLEATCQSGSASPAHGYTTATTPAHSDAHDASQQQPRHGRHEHQPRAADTDRSTSGCGSNSWPASFPGRHAHDAASPSPARTAPSSAMPTVIAASTEASSTSGAMRRQPGGGHGELSQVRDTMRWWCTNHAADLRLCRRVFSYALPP